MYNKKEYESGVAFNYLSFDIILRDENREYTCNIPDYRRISDFCKREYNKIGIIKNMTEII